jgi:catechol 2,3-dioxygenase-like lactoylglutathione lyase family enzyme
MVAYLEALRRGFCATAFREERTLKALLKLNHIVINVSDMRAMRNFFVDMLGCEVTNQDPEGVEDPRMVFLSLGEEHHDFALVQASKEAPLGQIHHIALEVENRYRLLETLATLIDKGADVTRGPLVHGIEGGGDFISGDSGHVSFFVKGPEITVEVFSQSSKRPDDYQYPPPWRDTIRKYSEERQNDADG